MVAEFVEELGASAETGQLARLIVSELATNALEFAPGADYRVSAERSDDPERVSITVRSVGQTGDVPDHGKFPANEGGRAAMRNRGLAIVHTVSDSVSTVANGDGTIDITAVLAIDIQAT